MEKFKTVKELNDKAAELKSAGDLSELVKLAEENGLEKEDAEDYMDSDDPEDCLCNATMAAIGRLNMEEQDLHLESQMKDWKDFIVQMLTEYPIDHADGDRDALGNAVFNPAKCLLDVLAAGMKLASEHRIKVDKRIIDKKLLDVLAAGLKLSSENRITVDMRIIKAAGLPESAAYIGMCGRDDLKRIILDYYLGKQV